MKLKTVSLMLAIALLCLAIPTFAQDGGDWVRRDKNGVRIGGTRVTLFDGPGIVNYEYKHRWMPGPAGAAAVIGIGAGAGAATGALVNGKKGAVIGTIVGAGAATGLWLYKNRTEKRRIF